MMELVITNEWRYMVGSAVTTVGDGDRLYRNIGGSRRLQQQAMEWQHGDAGAGGSLRKYRDRFATFQSLFDACPDSSGLTTAPLDEQRACLSGEPADQGPLPDLCFRQEARRSKGAQNGDVTPADVIADDQSVLRRLYAVMTDPQA
jgi:hypothetical protein